MNATLILLLSSLLMGTSFLSEVPEEGGSKSKGGGEATSYLSNHPLMTGAAVVRSPSGCAGDLRKGQYQDGDDEDDDMLDDRSPYGRPPRRRQPPPPMSQDFGGDECLVKFGLHYSSCFSKSKDFDDKLDQLQHHTQSWPRGGDRGGGGSNPCSTLQLLAKVKSSPLFERCQGNQYVVRTPYHMYNVKGELRYIVQDPPHLEQCYLEAQCSIPGDLCRGYLGVSHRSRTQHIGRCESRHCHHTLLAWDPEAPDDGTFFDIFEYPCCCSCQATFQRQQVAG